MQYIEEGTWGKSAEMNSRLRRAFCLVTTIKDSLHRQDVGWFPKRTNGENHDWVPEEMKEGIP